MIEFLRDAFRPSIAWLLTFSLFGASTYFVYTGAFDIKEWWTNWFNIVMMVVAFYFGKNSTPQ